MTDERLKIWIELGKWAIVSVGLVIMTTIINAGFKDREVGLNEIKEYDKYVLMVTDNTKISERRLLAQYFAHVTPSKKLKEGWASYFNIVDKEFQGLLENKENKQIELSEMRQSTDSSIFTVERVQQLVQEIMSIDDELTPTFNKTNNTSDYDLAFKWERTGFESILSKDLNHAIDAFESSENSYNTFHQVYEIGRFLKNQHSSGEEQNDIFWNNIYRRILFDYSWKMPTDIKNQLEELIK